MVSNSKPYLEPEPSPSYEFQVGDVVDINFGTPRDAYGNRIEPTVDLKKASSFLYVEGDYILTFESTATEAMIGTWQIKIKLSYSVNS